MCPLRMPELVLTAVLAVSWIQPAWSQNQSRPADPSSGTQAPSSSQDQKEDRAPVQSAPTRNGGDDLSLNWSDVEKNLWANAKTYVDVPVSEVVPAVPELKGLIPETSQEGLASLLDHVGQTCLDLLQHTPNLASREEQITQQRMVSRISHGVFVPVMGVTTGDRQEFGYLLSTRATGDGMELREYRTDKQWASD